MSGVAAKSDGDSSTNRGNRGRITSNSRREQGLPVLAALTVEAGLEAELKVEVAEAPLSLLISSMLTLTPR